MFSYVKRGYIGPSTLLKEFRKCLSYTLFIVNLGLVRKNKCSSIIGSSLDEVNQLTISELIHFCIPAQDGSSVPKTFLYVCLHSPINPLNSCSSLELDLQNHRLILWYVIVMFSINLLALFPLLLSGENKKKSLDLLLFCVISYRVNVALYKNCGERTTMWWKDSGAANKGASLTNS